MEEKQKVFEEIDKISKTRTFQKNFKFYKDEYVAIAKFLYEDYGFENIPEVMKNSNLKPFSEKNLKTYGKNATGLENTNTREKGKNKRSISLNQNIEQVREASATIEARKKTLCHEMLHSFAAIEEASDDNKVVFKGGTKRSEKNVHEGMTEWLAQKTATKHNDYFKRKISTVKVFDDWHVPDRSEMPYSKYVSLVDNINVCFPGSVEKVYKEGKSARAQFQNEITSFDEMALDIIEFDNLKQHYYYNKDITEKQKQEIDKKMFALLEKQINVLSIFLIEQKISKQDYVQCLGNLYCSFGAFAENQLTQDFKKYENLILKSKQRSDEMTSKQTTNNSLFAELYQQYVKTLDFNNLEWDLIGRMRFGEVAKIEPECVLMDKIYKHPVPFYDEEKDELGVRFVNVFNPQMFGNQLLCKDDMSSFNQFAKQSNFQFFKEGCTLLSDGTIVETTDLTELRALGVDLEGCVQVKFGEKFEVFAPQIKVDGTIETPHSFDEFKQQQRFDGKRKLTLSPFQNLAFLNIMSAKDASLFDLDISFDLTFSDKIMQNTHFDRNGKIAEQKTLTYDNLNQRHEERKNNKLASISRQSKEEIQKNLSSKPPEMVKT